MGVALQYTLHTDTHGREGGGVLVMVVEGGAASVGSYMPLSRPLSSKLQNTIHSSVCAVT